ncbi:MAG: hypothetical protein QOJ78_318 [Pseudonocardiales bacterium]|nr:hypothetical protein [Pseudonocardiales bacterium]
MTNSAVQESPGLLAEVDEAVSSALAWLQDQLATRGSRDDVIAHLYRVPYALALGGRRVDAARLLSWMEREVLDSNGDLQPGPMRTAFATKWASYPLAIIAQAAWHLERYATAAALLRRLTRFQDVESGGAYAQRPELRTSRRQDLFPTAQLGMTALTVGDDAAADGAFRWIANLYEVQPELPGTLYTATDGVELIVDPDAVAADSFGLRTRFDSPRQAFYNPGIAAAFLARFSARRGSTRARELADSYLALTVDGDPLQFDYTDSVQVCKFAWGAASLLDLDPRGGYRRHVERMARWFLNAQHADGHWQNSAFLLPDGPTVGSNIEVTAEFVQHLTVVSTALAGDQRG